VADFDAVSDATQAIANKLTQGLATLGQPPWSMSPAPVCQITDLRTPIGLPPPTPLLTLTLYEIIEDPSARNRPNQRTFDRTTGKVTTKRAPVALLLRYILTPWAADPVSDQLVLGRGIQTLYDNAIIGGADLVGTMFDDDEALKITMCPMSIEDRTWYWRSIESQYRLSANYEARVVNIQSNNLITSSPVTSRRLEYGGDP
jgi:hypothetical protein